VTRPWLVFVALLCAVWCAKPAAAQTEVDLALVLAVDASGSVNEERFELQRQGYADAFRNPRVLQAIGAGTRRRIAVAMMQWTGPDLHVVAVDWTLVRDQASAAALADQIQSAPRALFGGGTSLSGAIDFGAELLAESPFRGERRTIDVSGDGSNNRGRPADAAVGAGIVINGLPILTIEPDLDAYYRDNVIGGPGAFVIAVSSYEAFADAIVNKLVTEIALR
jgi:Mg-chelatase subunit ChlD